MESPMHTRQFMPLVTLLLALPVRAQPFEVPRFERSAAQTETAPTKSGPVHPGVDVLSGAGVAQWMRNERLDVQLTLTGMLSARVDHLRIGLLVDGDPGLLFWGGNTHFALLAGYVLDWEAPFRLEILGEAGVSHYSGLGVGFFDQVLEGPTEATLPYFGSKISANWQFGKRRGVLGVWTGVQFDVGTVDLSQVRSCLFGCETTHHVSHVGGGNWLVGVRVGFAP